MRGRLLKIESLLALVTLCSFPISKIFAQACLIQGTGCPPVAGCVDSARGCLLQGYGISARILRADSVNPTTSFFYVRVSAGATGYMFVTGESRLTMTYEGTIAGAAYGRGPLVLIQEPKNTCATAFGSVTCGFLETNGSVMTAAPNVTIAAQVTPSESYTNIGPSTSIVLNRSNVTEVDTGTLGPSTCDVRPSTERGDPINVASGNVYRNEIDAVINSGKIGVFSFERNYNSLQGELSSFGYGWQHNFDVEVVSPTTLQEGTGHRVPFFNLNIMDGLNRFIYGSPPGITDSLRRDPVVGKFFLLKRNGTTLEFLTSNQISLSTDRNGNQTRFIYTAGKLDTIKEPGGRFFKLVYTGARVTQLKNQAGTTLVTYEYYTGADTNYLKKVTYGDNSWVEYTYESTGTPKKLIKILTSDSNEYFYEYDSKGHAKLSYRSLAADSLKVSYVREITTGADGDKLFGITIDAFGNTDTLLTVPNGMATDRLLTKGRNAASCGTCADQYAYDDHSNPIRKISSLGVVDSMAYDVNDRMTLRIEAKRVGGTASFTRTHAFRHTNFDLVSRDSTGSVVNTSDSLVRRFLYDANGNDTMIIETGLLAVGTRYADTTRFTYNSVGQVTKIDGPRTDVGDTSRFFYNSTTGDLDSVREFIGSTVLTTKYANYDDFG